MITNSLSSRSIKGQEFYCSGITSESGISFSPATGNFDNFPHNKRVFVYAENSLFDSDKNLVGFGGGPSGTTSSVFEYSRGRYASAIFIPNSITSNSMSCGSLFIMGSKENISNGVFLLSEDWANGSTTQQPIQVTGSSSVQITPFVIQGKEYSPTIETRRNSSRINSTIPICVLGENTEPNPDQFQKIYRFEIKNSNDEFSFTNVSIRMFYSGEIENKKISSFFVYLFPTDIGDITLESGLTLSSEYFTKPGTTSGFYTTKDSSSFKTNKSNSKYFSFGLKIDGAVGCSLNGLVFKNEGREEEEYYRDLLSYNYSIFGEEYVEQQAVFENQFITSTLATSFQTIEDTQIPNEST